MEIVARRICCPLRTSAALKAAAGIATSVRFGRYARFRSYAFRTGQMAAYWWGDAHRWGNAEVRMPTA